MAHQRFLKPEFFTDADVAELPPLYRLFYQGLWCQADRNGILEDKPKQLKVRVMPYDDLDPEETIKELCRRRFVIRYRVGQQRLLAIRTWEKNQSVHASEKAGTLPSPAAAEEVYEPGSANGELTVSAPLADGQLTPFPSPVPVPVPVPGAARQNAPAQPPPRLPDASDLESQVAQVFHEEKGQAYAWGRKDYEALRVLLGRGEKPPEILRRLRNGFRRTAFPRIATVAEALEHWNHCATDEPTKPKDIRKGHVRAEDMRHSDITGEVKF